MVPPPFSEVVENQTWAVDLAQFCQSQETDNPLQLRDSAGLLLQWDSITDATGFASAFQL
jgi:hypothetical protein